MQIAPYLSFEGRAEEAIEFYKKALRAEVQQLMRFKDMPGGACPGGMQAPADKVMHAALRIGKTVVMASDGQCRGTANFSGIALSLNVANDDEAQRAFSALSEGGTVTMPLGKTFFSSSFGMLNDKFGVSWMVVVMPEAA
jgi:PhnB protein